MKSAGGPKVLLHPAPGRSSKGGSTKPAYNGCFSAAYQSPAGSEKRNCRGSPGQGKEGCSVLVKELDELHLLNPGARGPESFSSKVMDKETRWEEAQEI